MLQEKKNYPCHHRLQIIRSLSKLTSTPTQWICVYCTAPFGYHSWLNTYYPTILIFCSTSQQKGREVFSCWDNAQAFIPQAVLGRTAVSHSAWEKRTVMNREQLCWPCHHHPVQCNALGGLWGQDLSCSKISHLGEDRKAFPLGLSSPRLNA